MKQHLLLTAMALAMAITNSASGTVQIMDKCTGTVCPYTNYYIIGGSLTNITDTQCAAKAEEHFCWRAELGKCEDFTDTGYSASQPYAYCESLCERIGYNVYVMTSGPEFGCACETTPDGGWQDVGNGRERYYTYTYQMQGKCNVRSGETATSQYRCKSGYYGNPSSGCITCPANATCNGGTGTTTFICKYMYYKNGTTCTECPDSDAGHLGTLAHNGTAVRGETYSDGATSITECYIDGLSSYYEEAFIDTTGTFFLTDECFYQQ